MQASPHTDYTRRCGPRQLGGVGSEETWVARWSLCRPRGGSPGFLTSGWQGGATSQVRHCQPKTRDM